MIEYVDLQAEYKLLEITLKELKEKISKGIDDNYFAIEGVAVFKRKKESVRKTFDRNKALEYLTDVQAAECIKETKVKPSVSIMSWSNVQLQKQFIKEK